MRYDDPDIPLAVSDEDILLGKTDQLPPSDTENGAFWAVQVSLTLGTSAYATMALR